MEGWEHAAGPGLYGLGQPINALKPVGALESKAGSSIASVTLRKVIPYSSPTIKKVTTAILGRASSTAVLGGALGRLVPFVGWGLTVYDAGTFMINNQESIQQGMEARDNYIQQGLMPLR